MRKVLIIFRMYDPAYTRGDSYGNKETLSVCLREDGTLSYSLYGGWQDSGTPFATSNLQLKETLPTTPRDFKTTAALRLKISTILRTGVGSSAVYRSEIVNEIKDKPKAKSVSLNVLKVLKAQAKELIDLGDSHEKREGHGMMKVIQMLT